MSKRSKKREKGKVAHPDEGRIEVICLNSATPAQVIKALNSVAATRKYGQNWASTYVRSDKKMTYKLHQNTLTIGKKGTL